MIGDSKTHKPLHLGTVVLVYLLIASINMLWDFLSRGHAFSAWQKSEFLSLWMIPLILAMTAVYIALSWVGTQLLPWMKDLENLFSQLLTPISYFQILIISLLSGFVEEWLFRGILMSHFGLLVSSALFGLCHLIPDRRLWIWAPWSFLAGIVFGLLYSSTQSLWLCAVLHATINASVLILLNRRVFADPKMNLSS